jgi:hypothetical protein
MKRERAASHPVVERGASYTHCLDQANCDVDGDSQADLAFDRRPAALSPPVFILVNAGPSDRGGGLERLQEPGDTRWRRTFKPGRRCCFRFTRMGSAAQSAFRIVSTGRAGQRGQKPTPGSRIAPRPHHLARHRWPGGHLDRLLRSLRGGRALGPVTGGPAAATPRQD